MFTGGTEEVEVIVAEAIRIVEHWIQNLAIAHHKTEMVQPQSSATTK